jgi:hypothetical protein
MSCSIPGLSKLMQPVTVHSAGTGRLFLEQRLWPAWDFALREIEEHTNGWVATTEKSHLPPLAASASVRVGALVLAAMRFNGSVSAAPETCEALALTRK